MRTIVFDSTLANIDIRALAEGIIPLPPRSEKDLLRLLLQETLRHRRQPWPPAQLCSTNAMLCD